MEFKDFIDKYHLGYYEINQSKPNYFSIHVKNEIKFIFYPKSIKCLKKALIFLKKNKLNYVILGAKTNVYGYFNLIIIDFKYIAHEIHLKKNLIYVSANLSLNYLSYFFSKLNIKTFTYFKGLPGFVGGALFMNASCFNHFISDDLVSVKIMDENFKIRVIKKEELIFRYRFSSFQFLNYIILGATFKKIKDKDAINLEKEILAKRAKMPKGYQMGSIFKNEENFFAGEILEKYHFKGYRKNDVMMSLNHANILINHQSSIENVIDFINEIKLYIYMNEDKILENEVIEYK